MRALLRRLFRRPITKDTHVLVRYENGTTGLIGPMDRFTAEVLLVSVLAPNPFAYGRRVVSARLVLP